MINCKLKAKLEKFTHFQFLFEFIFGHIFILSLFFFNYHKIYQKLFKFKNFELELLNF